MNETYKTTEAETLVSRMEKLGYTLTGKVAMVAWGFWEGYFRVPQYRLKKNHRFPYFPKGEVVRAQLHENQIIFLKD